MKVIINEPEQYDTIRQSTIGQAYCIIGRVGLFLRTNNVTNITFIDLGTGASCIPCASEKLIPMNAEVTASPRMINLKLEVG